MNEPARWWSEIDRQLVESLTLDAAAAFESAWWCARRLRWSEIHVDDVLSRICLQEGAAKKDAGAILGAARVRCSRNAFRSRRDRSSESTAPPRFSPPVIAWVNEARARFEGLPVRTGMLLHALVVAPDLLASRVDTLAKLDAAELERKLVLGELASNERLERFRIPELRAPAMVRVRVAEEPCSFLRLQISGVASGAVRYWASKIVASPAELAATFEEDIREDAQLLALSFDADTILVEAYDAGRRSFRADLRPHLALSIAGDPYRFAAEHGIERANGTSSDELEELAMLDDLSAQTELQVRSDELAIPAPTSPPLPPGHAARFELDGAWKAHAPGWIGGIEFDPGSLSDGEWIEMPDLDVAPSSREESEIDLADAVAQGRERAALELLARGADPNALDGSASATALHYAVSEGRAKLVRALLEAGGDPNRPAADGRPPIFWAIGERIGRGHLHAVAALLDAGARVDARDAVGASILERAVAARATALVELLLSRGADPNAPDRGGRRIADAIDPLRSYGDRDADEDLTPLLRALAKSDAELPIATCVWLGDVARVTKWLDAGGDPNTCVELGQYRNRDRWPLILLAAREGQREIVSLLHVRGADLEAATSKGTTLLECAAEGDLSDWVEELAHRAPKHVLSRAVVLAARNGALAPLRALLARRPDLHGHAAIRAALESRARLPTIIRMVRMLIDAGAVVGDTDLARAAAIRDVQARAELLEILRRHAPPPLDDPKGLLPQLWRAIRKKRIAEVRALVDAGADVVRGRDPKWRETALGLAIGACCPPELITLLLDAGVDVDACGDSGLTPLHQAASYDQVEIVDLLVSRGADRGLRSPEGKTAYELASDEAVRRRLATPS